MFFLIIAYYFNFYLFLLFQSGLVRHNIEDAHQYLCNTQLETFSNVVGIEPIARRPVIEFIGQRVTSVNVTRVHEHTVAFMGTRYGRLKKVGRFIKTKEETFEFL
jgi:hypothetical protein